MLCNIKKYEIKQEQEKERRSYTMLHNKRRWKKGKNKGATMFKRKKRKEKEEEDKNIKQWKKNGKGKLLMMMLQQVVVMSQQQTWVEKEKNLQQHCNGNCNQKQKN